MKGVFAAVLTPMRDDLAVDRHAFAQHCDRLLDAGCHGLGIFGTTGEANSLSVEERVAAMEELVADGIPRRRAAARHRRVRAAGRGPLTQAALALGAPGVLASRPSTTRASPTTACSASSRS